MNPSEIDEVLKNEVVDRHSLFQLNYFVVGKEPTIQAKLWRCVRELQARSDSIDAITAEIEDSKDKIALAELDKQEKNNLDGPRQQIEARMHQRRVDSLKKTVGSLEKKLKYVTEEAEFFIKCFKKLEELEKVKAFDDEKAQKEFWNEKLTQELTLRNLLHQPFDLEMMKTILSLSDDMPIKAKSINLLAHIQKLSLESQQTQKGLN